MANRHRRTSFRALLAALTALMIASALPATAQGEEEKRGTYILATATTGGTYYPVGVALAALTKTKVAPEHGVSLSAISSAGSAENIRLLREREADFAILQGIFGAWAQAGDGPIKSQGPQTHLRSITLLWRNAEHFTIRSRYAKTGTMADLENLRKRKFSIGQRSSGAEQSGLFILRALGIEPGDLFTLVYQGYGQSAEALQNGTIDGMNTPAGVPVSAVTQAFAASGGSLRLLGFTPEQLAKVNKPYPLWSPFTIAAGTYPGQDAPVTTIASPNVLAVHKDVPEETVYVMTKAIFENLAFLANIHAATKDMSLDSALEGLPVPLHPGAERYFREAGLTIPETLVAGE